MIQITSEIRALEPVFLPKARRSGYVCPFCGNGSGKDGDGLKPFGEKHSYHCFKCGFSGDVIDLFGAAYGIEEFPDKIRAFAEYYGLVDDGRAWQGKPPEGRKPVHVPEPADKQKTEEHVDRSEYFAKCAAENDGSYLAKRGISLKTQKRFQIGFDPVWRNPKALETLRAKGMNPETVPGMPAVIIPRDKGSYLARDIRPEAEVAKDKRKYMKQTVGRISLFNGDALKSSGPVIIVEGEIDAMSVFEAGGNASALCSASNTRLIVEWITDNSKFHPMCVLMLDNDEAGRQGTERLKRKLASIGIACTIARYPERYKDPNDYWRADPKEMESFVLREIMSARRVAHAENNFIV